MAQDAAKPISNFLFINTTSFVFMHYRCDFQAYIAAFGERNAPRM